MVFLVGITNGTLNTMQETTPSQKLRQAHNRVSVKNFPLLSVKPSVNHSTSGKNKNDKK
jgi:hypothetical protein